MAIISSRVCAGLDLRGSLPLTTVSHRSPEAFDSFGIFTNTFPQPTRPVPRTTASHLTNLDVAAT